MSKMLAYKPDQVLTVRIADEEKQSTLRAARETHCSLSSYVRDCGITRAGEILAAEQRVSA